MWRSGIIVVVLGAACREKEAPEPRRTVAVHMSGTLSFEGDPAALGDGLGDVTVTLYRDAAEGFCLRGPEALVTVASHVVRERTAAELRAGIPYAFDVLEQKDMAYGFSVFPVAVFQRTQYPDNACEKNPEGGVDLRNARGSNGPDVSPCCGPVPVGLKVPEAETELSANLVLSIDSGREAACADRAAGFDRCQLRRDAAGSDSACAQALGDEAPSLLVTRDGVACP